METLSLLKEQISCKLFFDYYSPEELVKYLGSIKESIHIYLWYEGTQGVPKSGAEFMKESILKPLYLLKRDSTIYLYSLKGWDFEKNVKNMNKSTLIGEAINSKKSNIECIYSYSFFQYCMNISKESEIYKYFNEEIPKKEWLFKYSSKKQIGKKVIDLFNNQSSLFDFIKDLDVVHAYSAMQFIEGYYLIRESIKKGILKKQRKINTIFVLPNNEIDYYLDYPKDIEKILKLDFGESLINIDINIEFRCFKFKEITSRPYIYKTTKAKKIKPEEVNYYFDYLN
jgi:hypothetical protein